MEIEIKKQKSLESTKTGRIKVSENREYLDMDTDEEEFGLKETPEPEAEAPPEPDKPEFTDEELNALVQQTKVLTVLPGLSGSSWTESVLERIREYFCDPSNLVLTIYFSGKGLRALLDFPESTDDGLVYFLRAPWQIYRPGDFLTFGTVAGRIENTLFKFVDGLYSPLAFQSEWPRITKDKIFSNINDFLTRAVDATYKPVGMLVLYVPWEGNRIRQARQSLKIERESIIDIAHENEHRLLINRIEKVARTWIRQIQESLVISPSSTDELYDAVSEFAFWQKRYEKLACIAKQLKSDRILLIIHELKKARVSSTNDLKMLALKVDNALEEAKSNLIYLDILLRNIKAFNEPRKVSDCLPKILHIVRFIFSESPYYNVSRNIERLLCSLSVYVIKVCLNSTDLKVSMFDDLKKCEECIEASLSCLHSYSQIYDWIFENLITSTDNWRVNKIVVFKCVDAFEQRCRDVSEICDAIKIYGSSSKINFGGTRGNYHEMQYRRIKDYFSEIMHEMKISCDYALNITEPKWFQDMSIFRCEVDELENIMTNLLNSLFEDVVSVEMGIETLYILFKFKEHKNFAIILRKKWRQVWEMFSEEVKLCSEESIEYEICQDRAKLLQSEHSIISSIFKQYLMKLYKMMINASDWLGDCDVQFEAPLINFSREISD